MFIQWNTIHVCNVIAEHSMIFITIHYYSFDTELKTISLI